MRITQSIVAAAALALVAAGSASGAAISVNYDVVGTSTPGLAAGDVAGVVPSANWNNVTATALGQPFNYGITYVDDSGANTTLTVAASSGTGDSWNTLGTPDEIIFGDKSSWAGGTQTLTLTNIPYATYDLYIYSSEWGSEVVNFAVGGNVQTLSNTFTPQFNPAGDPDLVLNDTYVRFAGLSGDVVVDMTVVSGGLHLGGFQVVDAIPEPSSTFLLGVAGLMLAFRRRGA